MYIFILFIWGQIPKPDLLFKQPQPENTCKQSIYNPDPAASCITSLPSPSVGLNEANFGLEFDQISLVGAAEHLELKNL